MADLQLQLRLTADGSGLTGTLRTATGELRQFSTQARATNDAVNGTSISTGKMALQFGIANEAVRVASDVIGRLTGEFPRLVAQQINYAASVGDIAQRTGLSTQAISGMASSARLAGSDLTRLTAGLDTLGANAVKAAGGGKQQMAIFQAMGISLRDAGGHLKSTDALLGEVTKRLAGYADGSAKTALATQLFGSNARELMPVLDELGKEGLQGVIDKAGQLGQVIDGDMARAATDLQVQLRTLRERVTGIATDIASDLLPILARAADSVMDFVESARESETVRAVFAELWSVIGSGVGIIQGVTRELVAFAQDPALLQFLANTRRELEAISKLVPASIQNIKPGEPLSISWSKPDWLKRLSGEASDGAQGNAFAGMDPRQLVAMSKPLLDDLGRMWDTVTGKVDEFGLHVAQEAPKASAPIAQIGKAAKAAADDASGAQKSLDDLLDSLRGNLGASAKAQADYNKGMRELQERAYAVAIAGGDVDAAIAQWQEGEALLKQRLDATNAELARRGDVLGNFQAEMADQTAMLTMTARERAVAEAVKKVTTEYKTQAAAGVVMKHSLDEVAAGAAKAAGANFDLRKETSDLDQILQEFGKKTEFDTLTDQIKRVEDALSSMHDATGRALDPAQVEGMQHALGALNRQMEQRNLSLMQQGVSSLQQYAKEGTAAYTALGIAQDVLAYKSAIAAIANQGSGDPYSAFARIAAMIALMASIGIRVAGGGSSAPASQSAEARQAQQGTGSVLGDAAAKSESIAHAVDITAKATSQLVGINRGMLTALQALQNALGAAGNQLARGAGDANYGTFDPGIMLNAKNGAMIGAAVGSIIPIIGTAVGAVVGAVLGKLLGGSSKVIDSGIMISGGSLGDVGVNAYQTTQTKTWRFGSSKITDQLGDVGDQFKHQFQLVVSSIADTVRQGALALGLLPDDVEAALAQFRVEETRISLKGLSAEDQQKELEAVFSKLFDDLAGSVVPFIGKFQAVGEGLGETLVRIATEVQVAQEAFKQLGLAVDEADPERFAQISDSLIQAAGGLDAFISGMQSFVANFAPEGHQLAVASDALSSAFEQVGLTVPATREGMWELMQSLDATTDAGRAQIATLLRLADVADQYYTALDKQVSAATETLDSMGLLTYGLTEFGRSIVAIKAQESDAVDAANTLAKAHGAEGASAIQLAAIKQWALRQEAAAVRQLVADINRLQADLYGKVPGSLDLINQRIGELESVSASVASGIDTVADAGNTLFESWRNGVKSVQDYLDSMLLGDLSALTPEEQLAEAKRQLLAAQEAAMGGDADALTRLPQLADAFLRMARGMDASGGDYNAQFDWVRQLLQATVNLPNPGHEATGGGGGGGGGGAAISPELQALYNARDAQMEAQYAEQRRQLAQQLAEHLSDLAVALNVPIMQLIEARGLDLRQLATDLGADLSNLTASSIEALGNMSTTLGVPLGELVQQLGLSMPDLKEGLVELTQSLGIDLTALTGTTATQLAALAGSLGGNLSDLTAALGIDLGKLTDVDSPIFVALKDNIDTLSPDIRDELDPLLKAVGDASGDEAKNAAVKALRDHVDELAPDIKNQLAPFFDDILPDRALSQLDYLDDIQRIAGEQLTALGQINNNLAAANREAGIPSYAVGTGYVPSDGLAMIHQGEAVVPAAVNAWFKQADWQLPRGAVATNDDSALLREVRELRAEVAALRRDNNAGHAATATTTRTEADRARTQRDDIARRQEQSIRRTA